MCLFIFALRNEEVKNATHAHVTSLFVLSEYQGQGVGRRLLTASRMALIYNIFCQLIEMDQCNMQGHSSTFPK